ncbi:MAG: hypothetical protein ACPGSC_00315 [Granulosicoccaceae bacterium]
MNRWDRGLAVPLMIVIALASSVGLSVVSANESRIQDFAVYVPQAPVDCELDDPWRAGRWRLKRGGAIPSGGCLSLSYTLNAESYALLLYESPSGEWVRFSPEQCAGERFPVHAAGEHWYPRKLDQRERLLLLDETPGFERFHLLVFSAEQVARGAMDDWLALPSLEKQCSTAGSSVQNSNQFNARLRSGSDDIDRATLEIEHY